MASAPVRSRRFFGPLVLASGSNTLVYTVPGGRTAIIRSVWFANDQGTAATVSLRVNGNTSASTVFTVTVPPFSAAESPPELVLNPDDELYIFVGGLVTVKASAYGSLLDGAPS